LPELPKLERLILDDINVKSIDGLTKAPGMTDLDITRIKGLSNVKLVGCHSLKNLHLEGSPADENWTKLLQVELKDLKNLDTVFLKGCLVEKLTLAGLPSLRELQVSGNLSLPKSISLEAPKLQTMQVSQNAGLESFEVTNAIDLAIFVRIDDNKNLTSICLRNIPVPEIFEEQGNPQLARVVLQLFDRPGPKPVRYQDRALAKMIRKWRQRKIGVEISDPSGILSRIAENEKDAHD